LRAFTRVHRELPAARLTIVGDGPERHPLEQLRHELHLTSAVEMRPHLARGDLERIADAAWVQAVPSVWAEPFGLAVAEAMMRGTAVVASSSGGVPNVVGDLDPNALVPPGDEHALATSLLAFLTDRARCERVGQAARRSALERFAAERVADRFLDHYTRLGASL
jgi:glycosyltransferase involved in cell wall biosynthesis